MLWKRSLVMIDVETRSLWSHLLGRAMAGALQGAELEALPSELTTWDAWRKEHPQTTVLNLSRTDRNYVREFYRRPGDFVYGLVVDGRAYHVPFPVLQGTPVLNLDLKDADLLVTFSPESTAARLFSRTVQERTLTFRVVETDRMRDEETGTIWDRSTGEAIEGALKGTSLKQQVGITSYARAWREFHPDSRSVSPTQ